MKHAAESLANERVPDLIDTGAGLIDRVRLSRQDFAAIVAASRGRR